MSDTTFDGNVKYNDIEGGFYTILDDSGYTYRPDNSLSTKKLLVSMMTITKLRS